MDRATVTPRPATRRSPARSRVRHLFLSLLAAVMACAGCMSPVTNLVHYAMSEGEVYLEPAREPGTGTLQGTVLDQGAPVAGATVLVAEPEGTPHVTRTDAQGRYTLEHIPPGHYVPIAVAAGYEDAVLRNAYGFPMAMTMGDGQTIAAGAIHMKPTIPNPLPPDAAAVHELTPGEAYVVETPYPEGAVAQVQPWSFSRNGTVNDTLHVYLPGHAGADDGPFPLLFAMYPGHSLRWEDISVGFASQGYAVVATSPLLAYGRDVIEHGEDARLALHFAMSGALGEQINPSQPLAISGSYGAAVLSRLVRITEAEIRAAVVLGGISNAFTGAAAFYAGHLDWPPHLGYILASLGTANAKPLGFMEFAPVYSAGIMPPMFLIHTFEDEMVPIEQSYEYAAALEAAGVEVRTHYFEDESHYIQIGERTSEVTKELFQMVLAYLAEKRVVD